MLLCVLLYNFEDHDSCGTHCIYAAHKLHQLCLSPVTAKSNGFAGCASIEAD